MPEIQVTETVSFTTRQASEDEKIVAARWSSLTSRAMDWAERQFVCGDHDTQLAIFKSLSGAAARAAALDGQSANEEMKGALDQLVERMKSTPPPSIPASSIDVGATPIHRATVDQDERSRDTEV